jgi:Two component regulator propeller
LFSYNQCNGIAVGNGKVFGGKYGLLIYDIKTNEYTQYTKVNGLSDVGIVKLAFEPSKDALVITYQSSDIDILQNGIIYHIPDLKNANISASKKINNVSFINGDAYISTGIGIVIINVDKHEVKATYPMLVNGAQAEVFDVGMHNNQLYTCTSKGLFKANINSNFLQNIENWQSINTDVFSKMLFTSDSFYLAKANNVYTWDGGSNTHLLYTNPNNVLDMVYAKNKLQVACFESSGAVVKMNKDGSDVVEINGQSPTQLAVDDAENLWVANEGLGICKLGGIGDLQIYKIDGPAYANCFNLRHIDGSLYVAGGAVDPQYNFKSNRSGFYQYNNQQWRSFNQNNYPQMDSILDYLDMEQNRETKSIYAASYGGGFIEITKDGKLIQLARNSVIQSFGSGEYAWMVTNLKMDNENNLWVTVTNVDNNLMVLKKDGNWKAFKLPTVGDVKVMGQIEIDNVGQKWIVLPRNRGLMVFSDNQTLDNTADDQQKIYMNTPGNGNLASNNVRCIAIDKDGKVWVGSDNGISIINCPENAFGSGGCDAENKIVQYDIAAGKLFQDQYVTSIAVDGANRKWIGTGGGVWLISADAEKILAQFNTNNSPLPSNDITKIEIDPASGVVYIATVNGLVSYKSTATDGATTDDNEPLVYPNPVEPNYAGTIAIKGLVNNADVRIIDAAGQLVYRTVALGGQAVWNGKTYTGQKPQSGVYYVLATNSDGSLTQRTKFIFKN